MNHLLFSASVATGATGVMLLWKLLTGDHSDPEDGAEQEFEEKGNTAALHSPRSAEAFSSNCSAASTPGGNAEASALWADASSQCADDEPPPTPLRLQSFLQHLQQQPDGQQQDVKLQQEQSELHASESYISAASIDADEAEVTSASNTNAILGALASSTITSCAADRATQSTATTMSLPVARQEHDSVAAQDVMHGSSTAATGNTTQKTVQELLPHTAQESAAATVQTPAFAALAVEQEAAGVVAETAANTELGSLSESPEHPASTAVQNTAVTACAAKQAQVAAACAADGAAAVDAVKEQQLQENAHTASSMVTGDLELAEAATAAAAAPDEGSSEQATDVAPAAEALPGAIARGTDGVAEAGSTTCSDAGSVDEDDGARHMRKSSSEQVVFGAIESRIHLGGLLGDWQGSSRFTADAEWPSAIPSVVQSAAGQPEEPQQQTEQPQLADEQLGQQQQQQEQALLLQKRKLQPLNAAAAADAVADERNAMTDSVWASLRTVEVGREQLASNSSTARLPPLPRGPSGTGSIAANTGRGTDSFSAAGAVNLQRGGSSSDSECSYACSAFALPGDLMAGSLSLCAASTSAVSSMPHSRTPSRATSGLSGDGSLFAPLSDWPSLQIGTSARSASQSNLQSAGSAKVQQLLAAAAAVDAAQPAKDADDAQEQPGGIQMERPAPTAVSEQERPAPTAVSEQEQPAPTAVSEQEQPAPTAVSEQEQPAPTAVSEQEQPALPAGGFNKEQEHSQAAACRAAVSAAIEEPVLSAEGMAQQQRTSEAVPQAAAAVTEVTPAAAVPAAAAEGAAQQQQAGQLELPPCNCTQQQVLQQLPTLQSAAAEQQQQSEQLPGVQQEQQQELRQLALHGRQQSGPQLQPHAKQHQFQQQQAQQHITPLLQPEMTLLSQPGGSYNSSAEGGIPSFASSGSGSLSRLTTSGSLRSRKQQQQWKQMLQHHQQEQLQASAADGSPQPPPAAAAVSLKSLLLQTGEAGGIAAGLPVPAAAACGGGAYGSWHGSNNATAGEYLQSCSSSADTLLDPAVADLAAGLTAPRSWTPSRAAMAAAGHSKLSIMTTAADAEPLVCDSAAAPQQKQQQQQHMLGQSNSTFIATVDGSSRHHFSSGYDGTPSSSSSSQALLSIAAPAGAAGSDGAGAAPAGSADAPWLRLVVSAGPAAGRRFETSNKAQELVIGRNPVCWASIPDQEISGKHACLFWSATSNCWQLTDAGSLNGTCLNGKLVSSPGRQPGCPTSLRHGDKLELGSITRVIVECGPRQQQQQQQAQLQVTQQQQQGVYDPCGVTLQAGGSGGLQQQPEQHRQQPQQQGQSVPAWAATAQQQQQAHPQQQQSTPDTCSCSWPSSPKSNSHSTAAAAAAQCSHNSNGRTSSSNSPRSSSSFTRSFACTWGAGVNAAASTGATGLPTTTTTAAAAAAAGGGGSAHQASPRTSTPGLWSAAGPCSPGALLTPVILLQFPACRIEGAVVKVVGADHRRSHSPCEDVVAWRTPLAQWQQVGLFCVFDGHHSRNASQQAQELLPDLLAQHLPPQQQQQQQDHHGSRRRSNDSSSGDGQTQQQQQQLLADEAGIAAALTASFLETDKQLTSEDGCTATALLLEGCEDGSVLLRVANVGDSMAVLVDLCSAGWRSLTEDHRIADNPAEAARLTAKNPGGVGNRLYGLNIARMLGDRFLKEADVGFTAEPYVSEGIELGVSDEALIIAASDGLWDVVSQERAAALAAKAAAAAAAAGGGLNDANVAGRSSQAKSGVSAVAGSTAAEVGPGSSSSSSTAGTSTAEQQERSKSSSVAASVAEVLMHAALTLRSKDDISIMVLHVLPAPVVESRVVGGTSASGCM